MRPDTELLLRVLRQIKGQPGTWNQTTWVRLPAFPRLEEPECGTAYCFAGWAARFSGYSVSGKAKLGWIAVSALPQETVAALGEYAGNLSGELQNSVDGTVNVHVSTLAKAVLRLTCMESDRLFNGDNSLEDLERIVQEIIDEHGERYRAEAARYDLLNAETDARDAVLAEAIAILETAAPTEPALV